MSLVPLSFLLIGLIVAAVLIFGAWGSVGGVVTKLSFNNKKHQKEMQDLRDELLLLAHSFDTDPSYTTMEAYELELQMIKDKLIQLAMPNKSK